MRRQLGGRDLHRSLLAASFWVSLVSNTWAAGCEVADILFRPIELDILKKEDYETAIIRSATFDDPERNFGALLGEITVDRGGFAVRNANQVVVGLISPDLEVEGMDDACATSKAEIVRAKKGAYVIINHGRPVGTISGQFPKNGFGVN